MQAIDILDEFLKGYAILIPTLRTYNSNCRNRVKICFVRLKQEYISHQRLAVTRCSLDRETLVPTCCITILSSLNKARLKVKLNEQANVVVILDAKTLDPRGFCLVARKGRVSLLPDSTAAELIRQGQDRPA